jgi:hypothetical protein
MSGLTSMGGPLIVAEPGIDADLFMLHLFAALSDKNAR